MRTAEHLTPSSAWPVVWAVLAAAITLLWWLGFRPNADLDDVMKLHEIRHVFASGSLFDRTIPGVLQPEPMVSHWPWIVDAPYLLFAGLLNLFLPLEIALSITTMIVPPLLLMLVVWLLAKIIRELGFTNPLPVLALSAAVAVLSATEFQPGRIDYHNLQMIALVAITLLTMRSGVRASILCGAMVALSLAFSPELAGFLALALAVFAGRFVLGQEGGREELRGLGLGLIVSAVVLYLLVTPPASYGLGLPDRYSAVHLVALVGAGLTFVLAASIGSGSFFIRAALLAVGAALSLALTVWLYPQVLGGPYAALSPYVRENWLAAISQDASILSTPQFGQGLLFQMIAPGVIGIGAAMVFAFQQKPLSRAWTVYALFAAAALLQAILALRFMRIAPLFGGPGLALVLAAILPSLCTRLGEPFIGKLKPILLLPGLAVVAAIMLLPNITQGRIPKVTGVMIADSCQAKPKLNWPHDSRLLAPPGLGTILLAPANGASVVAVPFHTANDGIERVYRFFDGETSDAQAIAIAAQATHVVVCQIDTGIAERFAASHPLATALGKGQPPAWLEQCPAPSAGIEIYRVIEKSAGCPALP